ncbi:hypothetical protein SEA_ELINAL_2 [Gordonia phage Elinal]|nr:hypothetical protein SEA_ELINAL_2 [Gordonia phage Elinal]
MAAVKASRYPKPAKMKKRKAPKQRVTS